MYIQKKQAQLYTISLKIPKSLRMFYTSALPLEI